MAYPNRRSRRRGFTDRANWGFSGDTFKLTGFGGRWQGIGWQQLTDGLSGCGEPIPQGKPWYSHPISGKVRRNGWTGREACPTLLRGRLAGDVFEAALADFLLAHDELLDFFRDGHGEVVDEADVLGDLEVSDFPLAECLNFLRRGGLAGFELHPRQDGFTEAGVGDADDVDVGDLGMGVQEVLDFARVDVLSAADNGVLGASAETEIAVGTHGGEIAGVEPAFGIDDGGGGFGIRVVAFHDQVAAGAEFTLLSDGDLPSL